MLCIYYAIVFFHLPNPFVAFDTPVRSVALLAPFIYLWLFFTLGGLTIKGGFILASIYRGAPRAQAIKVFIALNLYLAVFEGATFAVLWVSHYGLSLPSSGYFRNSHLFWISVSLVLVFYLFYRNMVRFDLLRWQALSDLKAIPFVSPAFCFGAPVLLKSNAAPITFDPSSSHVYVLLSFGSGILFIFYLIFFAFNDHAIKRREQTSISPIANQVRDQSYIRRTTMVGFLLFAAALYLLLIAVLDLVVVASVTS